MFGALYTFDIYKHPVLGLEAVKRGFNIPAFFFGMLWAFAKAMWVLGLVLWVFLVLCFMLVATLLELTGKNIGIVFLNFIPYILIGTRANGWRRGHLKSNGYKHEGTVEAHNRADALARYG